MSIAFNKFDITKLKYQSLKDRKSRLYLKDIRIGCNHSITCNTREWMAFIRSIKAAKSLGKPVVLMMGAHPIKLGLSWYIADLVQRGWITHVAMSGAGLIHEYELCIHGETSERVEERLDDGLFGMCAEAFQINGILERGWNGVRKPGIGETMGRAIGMALADSGNKDVIEHSILATCYENDVPATVHISIGQDVVVAGKFSGAHWGDMSYWDFLIFAETVRHLQGGIVINLGSAVMGPEIFLKALSMARNVEKQEGREVDDFVVAVMDLQRMTPEMAVYRGDANCFKDESKPDYYNRMWKTLLSRAIKNPVDGFYFEMNHKESVPSLWNSLTLSGTQER